MSDALLIDDNDSGEIIGESEGGLPTAVYISWFGSHTTQVEQLLDRLPSALANLRQVETAAENDLRWMITERVAISVDVTATLVTRNRVKLSALIDGNETIDYVTNWKEEEDNLQRTPFGDVGVVIPLPLDVSNLQIIRTVAYNDVVMLPQGDALFRPALNVETTAYNETVDVPQGDALFRPSLNVNTVTYNETVDVPQGDALFRPLINAETTAYNETVDVPQGDALFRPLINAETTAYNQAVELPLRIPDPLATPTIGDSTAFNDSASVDATTVGSRRLAAPTIGDSTAFNDSASVDATTVGSRALQVPTIGDSTTFTESATVDATTVGSRSLAAPTIGGSTAFNDSASVDASTPPI